MSPENAARDELSQITSELTKLAATGQLLPGSIQQRHTRCGKPGCACQADPPRPHGPYWQWTRKVAGKTVTRRLSAQQTERYRPWIANDRRIHELIARLEQIAIADLEAAQHPDRSTPKTRASRGQPAPNPWPPRQNNHKPPANSQT